ncbi:hypothetical protein T492DRAFT_1033105 [Pavlovales sp. CCMP2436]|nr:hypothetical protein T492DRAFT_1033105 [Pavlovales sp. CCMP2436]
MASLRELSREEFALQELWSAHTMLGISHLLALRPVDGLEECYRLGHHVIRRFDVLGSNPKGGHRLLIALDDGSADIPLSSLLRARGRMSTFRIQRQLTAWHISVERDPLAEPLRWLELEQLWREVYLRDPRPASGAPGLAADERAPRLAPQTAAPGASADLLPVCEALEKLFRPPARDPAGGDGPMEVPPAGETEIVGAVDGAQPLPPRPAAALSFATLLDPTGAPFQAVLRCAHAAVARAADEAKVHAAAKRLVTRALCALKADGVIELVDADADVYARFDPEAQLLPAIIRHASRATGQGDGSITLDRLKRELGAHDHYAFTAFEAALQTAIETLLERSLLYETGRDSFHLMTS